MESREEFLNMHGITISSNSLANKVKKKKTKKQVVHLFFSFCHFLSLMHVTIICKRKSVILFLCNLRYHFCSSFKMSL